MLERYHTLARLAVAACVAQTDDQTQDALGRLHNHLAAMNLRDFQNAHVTPEDDTARLDIIETRELTITYKDRSWMVVAGTVCGVGHTVRESVDAFVRAMEAQGEL
jgi:hypothetical protein